MDIFQYYNNRTAEVANGDENVTVFHAVYVIAEILAMSEDVIIEKFGADEVLNAKLLKVIDILNRDVKKDFSRQKVDKIVKIDSIYNLDEILIFFPLYFDKLNNLPKETLAMYVDDYAYMYKEIMDKYKETYEHEEDPFVDLDIDRVQVNLYESLIHFLNIAEKMLFIFMLGSNNYDVGFIGMFYDAAFSIPTRRSAKISKKDDSKVAVDKIIKDGNELLVKLQEVVIGQDAAIKKFADGYIRSYTFQNRKNKPKAVFLFAGPPGVGKSYLAQKAAELLGRKSRIFDMSEYAGGEQVAEGLVGYEYTYKKAQPGVLTSYVDKHPDAIIIFDEIEKAAQPVQKLFLQILEGGRLTDKYTEKTVSFENTILVFTTNAGRDLYEENEDENLTEFPQNVIISALEEDKSFPKELVSRFASNNIIVFNHLDVFAYLDLIMTKYRETVTNVKKNTEIQRIEYSEILAQAYLMSKSDNLDARIISNGAETMMCDLIQNLITQKVENGTSTPIKEIKISVDPKKRDKETYNLIVHSDKNPIDVLYVTDDKEVDIISEDIKEWIRFEYVKNTEELRKAFEKKSTYDMAVVNLYTGSNGKKIRNIFNEDTEGMKCLNTIIDSTKTIPAYVEYNENITALDYRRLRLRGVREMLPLEFSNRLSNKWYKAARRVYIERSMQMLEADDKVIDYQAKYNVKKDGTAEIILTDFILRDGSEEDTETRKKEKEHLLNEVQRPKLAFSDVIGNEQAKKELKEFISYIQNPDKYEMMGAKVSRGVLLYGPPGTGKTLLAKATAGEARTSFIATTGTEILNKGAEEVKFLFKTARKHSPCIIFIDEIDPVAKERIGVNPYQEEVLNTFLTEMDGFNADNKHIVFVIAATNFGPKGNQMGKEMALDGALLRRFGKEIFVSIPNFKDLEKYLKLTLTKMGQTAVANDAEAISTAANMMYGRSLAEVERMLQSSIRKAVMESIENGDESLMYFTKDSLDKYMQEYLHGERNSKLISMETAYHEAGHAFMCCHAGNPPLYMTVAGRGGYNGFFKPKYDPDKHRMSKEDYINHIRICLGGRAAELVIYGESDKTITSGASSDLQMATETAIEMVTEFGMADGKLAVIPQEMLMMSPVSEDVMTEVNTILLAEMEETKRIIKENVSLVKALGEKCYKEVVLYEAEIRHICKMDKA